MKIRAAALTALVTIAVLSVGGCGGDGDEGGASTEDYVAKADAICAAADKKQLAVPGGQENGVYDNFSNAVYLSRYNAVTRDALKRLKALDAPSDQRKEVDAFLTAVEGTVTAVDKQVAALRAKDLPSQSQANRDFQMSYGNIGAAAGALGLSRCQGLSN